MSVCPFLCPESFGPNLDWVPFLSFRLAPWESLSTTLCLEDIILATPEADNVPLTFVEAGDLETPAANQNCGKGSEHAGSVSVCV